MRLIPLCGLDVSPEYCVVQYYPELNHHLPRLGLEAHALAQGPAPTLARKVQILVQAASGARATRNGEAGKEHLGSHGRNCKRVPTARRTGDSLAAVCQLRKPVRRECQTIANTEDLPRRLVNCIDKCRMSIAACDGPGTLSCDAWLLWLPCLDVLGLIRDANDLRRCELSSELLDLRRPSTDNLICFSRSSRLRTSPSKRCTSYSLY